MLPPVANRARGTSRIARTPTRRPPSPPRLPSRAADRRATTRDADVSDRSTASAAAAAAEAADSTRLRPTPLSRFDTSFVVGPPSDLPRPPTAARRRRCSAGSIWTCPREDGGFSPTGAPSDAVRTASFRDRFVLVLLRQTNVHGFIFTSSETS